MESKKDDKFNQHYRKMTTEQCVELVCDSITKIVRVSQNESFRQECFAKLNVTNSSDLNDALKAKLTKSTAEADANMAKKREKRKGKTGSTMAIASEQDPLELEMQCETLLPGLEIDIDAPTLLDLDISTPGQENLAPPSEKDGSFSQTFADTMFSQNEQTQETTSTSTTHWQTMEPVAGSSKGSHNRKSSQAQDIGILTNSQIERLSESILDASGGYSSPKRRRLRTTPNNSQEQSQVSTSPRISQSLLQNNIWNEGGPFQWNNDNRSESPPPIIAELRALAAKRSQRYRRESDSQE